MKSYPTQHVDMRLGTSIFAADWPGNRLQTAILARISLASDDDILTIGPTRGYGRYTDIALEWIAHRWGLFAGAVFGIASGNKEKKNG